MRVFCSGRRSFGGGRTSVYGKANVPDFTEHLERTRTKGSTDSRKNLSLEYKRTVHRLALQ